MKQQYCLHYFISGLVQGVFYRDSTRKKAQALDITGWVKNLPDGRVELIACGEQNQLKALEKWLWEGPPKAKVSDVRVEKTDLSEFVDFTIR